MPLAELYLTTNQGYPSDFREIRQDGTLVCLVLYEGSEAQRRLLVLITTLVDHRSQPFNEDHDARVVLVGP